MVSDPTGPVTSAIAAQPQVELQSEDADALDALKASAASLISGKGDPQTTEAAGRILAQVAEIEKQIAEANKARTERRKLEQDLSTTSARMRSDERKHIATLLAPILTTIILAGTLVLQTYQTLVAEREKREDQQRLREAAEDVRWAETLKTLSAEVKGIAPGSLSFLTFFDSPRYGQRAKETAQTVMLQSKDFQQFRQLFTARYPSLGWSDWSSVVDLHKRMVQQNVVPIQKAYRKETLTSDEQDALKFITATMSFFCSQVTPLLRSLRPADFQLDLTYVSLGHCRMSGANLSGADLNGFNPTAVNFEDVDFTGAKNYQTATWGTNVWWRSKRMNKDMLQFLSKNFPFNPDVNYGHSVSQVDYDTDVQRLAQ